MLEPWNDRSLLAPPTNTFLCKNKKGIKNLSHIIYNAIDVLSKQSPLHNESAILSRFLYKFDKKFRNDIGYRDFKKVNTALKKYLALNLHKDISSFACLLPNENDELYLPTRQMLEYLLIKVMSFSKLMSRIVVSSKKSAVFYLDRIQRGESHWMCLMPYALLSRIWSMTAVLLQYSCNWYNQLYPILGDLEMKGVPFLPSNYKLPIDLEEWLDLKNLNDHGHFQWTNKIKINISQIFMEDDNMGDMCENIIDYVNQINEDTENTDEYQIKLPSVKEIMHHPLYNKHTELGVAISRESFNSNVQNQPSHQDENISAHCIDRVTNNNTLNEFLNKEEELRNESNDNALTSHLSFMQWQALKASLLNLNCDKSVNRKLKGKIKKIWKEKCLDYK